MVKTRAQREQGFVTPSPKTVDQGQVKNQGTSRRRNDATQKSRNGTEVKSSNKRQDMMITNTPRSTRNTKMPRRKSPNTNKSKEKRQKTPAKQAGRVDKEDDNNEDEDDGEGCHGDLQSDDDAIQQKADMKSRKSVRKQRKGHNVREVEETAITEPALEEEDDDETMESEENEGQEEEEEMEELQEGEEEEKEDSESKSDALDTDDASLHQKPQTTEGGFMTSIAKEIDAESDDDDAPQDISFSASRQEALDSISQALQQTKRTEERAKEKRRNRDKLLKLQKERKKISLEHSRLPEDFLSEVARTPDGQLLEQSVVASTHQRTRKEQQHHKVFDSDGEMDFDEGDDYIPLSSDEPKVVEGFEVHAISRQKRAPPPKSDMALDFLQQQLYGAKIKRESVIKHKARLLKRQGKPSLVFQNPKEKRRKHKHQGSSKATGVRQ